MSDVAASQPSVVAGANTTVPFRPAAGGLVNFTALVTAQLPPPGGGGGNEQQPAQPAAAEPVFQTVGVRLDLIPPGATSAIASSHDEHEIPSSGQGAALDLQVVVSVQAMASAAQLTGDWTAVATNTGSLTQSQVLTVTFQTVAGNLGKVDHIVVLMMENRSFDHMLGHLSLTGGRTDVDGLTPGMVNPDASGHEVPIALLTSPYFLSDPGHGWTDVDEQLGFDLSTGKRNGGFVRNFAEQLARQSTRSTLDVETLSPGEVGTFTFTPSANGVISVQCVPATVPQASKSGLLASVSVSTLSANQQFGSVDIAVNSGVGSFEFELDVPNPLSFGALSCSITNRSDDQLTFSTTVTYPSRVADVESIMGYYDGTELPVYDFLAEHYSICDRWFSSIPTDTFPNRLYALSGGSAGLDTTPSGSSVSKNPPAYGRTTIFEVLQQHRVEWRNYYSDIPFALVFSAIAQSAELTARIRPLREFLEAARTGTLPPVSWIDPSFLDAEEALGDPVAANDDHPPGFVSHGQEFVRMLYEALSTGPTWSKTLFVITYDEHGGFFDHVLPPGTPQEVLPPIDPPPTKKGTLKRLPGVAAASVEVGAQGVLGHPVIPIHLGGGGNGLPSPGGPPDDDPKFARYGLRVPAFVISPWVPARSTDHGSYDHTSILATILHRFCADDPPSMGARTDHATDLSGLLSEVTPNTTPPVPPGPQQAVPEVGQLVGAVGDSFGGVLRQGLFGF